MSEGLEERLWHEATERHDEMTQVYASDVVELLDERDARIAELRTALTEFQSVLRDLRQNDLPQIRADVVGLMEESKQLRSVLDHIKAWAKQNQEALTSRQVADAVIRMCDDVSLVEVKA